MDIPWFSDDEIYSIQYMEYDALEFLTRIAQIDPQLVELIVSIPWFRDDITIWEDKALRGLTRISFTDPELAKRIISSSGFADGISEVEANTLHDLAEEAEPA